MKILIFGMLLLFSSVYGDGMVTRFFNARVLLDHRIERGELWVEGGRVISPRDYADAEVDVKNRILAPGYIDLQINGGFGCDFSRNPEEAEKVAKGIVQYGVTSFLPTLVSSSPAQYKHSLPLLQPKRYEKGAEILGIHLEGPFFAERYKGAHNPQLLISPINCPVEEVYGDLEGVKIVTLAPELSGAKELIHYLKAHQIIVSAGHSAATYEQMLEGIQAGIGLTTHLFNAMPPFLHRQSGIIGAALINPQIPYSLIVDGVHINAETVVLCWKCNPEGLILISDATEALGLPEGRYKLGTNAIEVKGDVIYLVGTTTIAGSNLRLDKGVRLLHALTRCSKEEALEAASLKPAKLLELYPKKGSLSPGADADFVVLTEDLEVDATYVGGVLAWQLHDSRR